MIKIRFKETLQNYWIGRDCDLKLYNLPEAHPCKNTCLVRVLSLSLCGLFAYLD